MSNADLLREAYARYNRRDFAFVDEMLAESIDWRIPGVIETSGREGVHAFFQELAEQFDAHAITMTDSVDAGDRIVAFVTHTFTRHDGESGDVLAMHAWTVEDGTLTALYEIADSASFLMLTGQIPAPA